MLLSEKRGKERAARLAAARAGKAAPSGKPKKSEAQKKVARDFYNQVGAAGQVCGMWWGLHYTGCFGGPGVCWWFGVCVGGLGVWEIVGWLSRQSCHVLLGCWGCVVSCVPFFVRGVPNIAVL